MKINGGGWEEEGRRRLFGACKGAVPSRCYHTGFAVEEGACGMDYAAMLHGAAVGLLQKQPLRAPHAQIKKPRNKRDKKTSRETASILRTLLHSCPASETPRKSEDRGELGSLIIPHMP